MQDLHSYCRSCTSCKLHVGACRASVTGSFLPCRSLPSDELQSNRRTKATQLWGYCDDCPAAPTACNGGVQGADCGSVNMPVEGGNVRITCDAGTIAAGSFTDPVAVTHSITLVAHGDCAACGGAPTAVHTAASSCEPFPPSSRLTPTGSFACAPRPAGQLRHGG